MVWCALNYFFPLRGPRPSATWARHNTKGIALIASGTYNAGEGLVTEAEEHFAEAFEMFAPVRTTRSEQAHPVRNCEVV